MPNFVALDFAQHRHLRLATGHGAALGDGLGMVSVVPSEIPALVNAYPLFFRKGAGGFELGAMLGFAADENLFLREGGWQAAYVPLVQRCQPFAVQRSTQNEGRNTLMIDLDSPRLTREGDALFFSDGRPSERLQASVDALEALVKGAALGAAYAAALDALGLIEPVELRVDMGAGAPLVVPGLFGLAAERLAGLSSAEVAGLHERGFLPWVYQQAASVGQVANLILARQQGARQQVASQQGARHAG